MTTTTSSGPDWIRDEDYYLQNATFLVENRLFKVPVRHFLEVSEVFRAMFELPQGNGGSTVEGTSDENPILLESVKSDDFKQLLRILFARRHLELEIFTFENWTSVLELSTKWDMRVIRELAIRNMSAMMNNNPHMQLAWGQIYDVDRWVFEGASSLVNRLGAMEEYDVEKLGLQTALKIAKLREDLKNREVTEYQSLTGYLTRKAVNEKIALKAEERVRAVFDLSVAIHDNGLF